MQLINIITNNGHNIHLLADDVIVKRKLFSRKIKEILFKNNNIFIKLNYVNPDIINFIFSEEITTEQLKIILNNNSNDEETISRKIGFKIV